MRNPSTPSTRSVTGVGSGWDRWVPFAVPFRPRLEPSPEKSGRLGCTGPVCQPPVTTGSVLHHPPGPEIRNRGKRLQGQMGPKPPFGLAGAVKEDCHR